MRETGVWLTMKLRSGFFKIIIVSIFLLAAGSPPEAGGSTDFSLRDWMDKDGMYKIKLVREYIAAAGQDHVIIRQPAEYYVKEIDTVVQNSTKNGNTAGLENPVGLIVKIIAIMDGDWDNGEDKLELARQFMGPVAFDNFVRQYLGKYQKLMK